MPFANGTRVGHKDGRVGTVVGASPSKKSRKVHWDGEQKPQKGYSRLASLHAAAGDTATPRKVKPGAATKKMRPIDLAKLGKKMHDDATTMTPMSWDTDTTRIETLPDGTTKVTLLKGEMESCFSGKESKEWNMAVGQFKRLVGRSAESVTKVEVYSSPNVKAQVSCTRSKLASYTSLKCSRLRYLSLTHLLSPLPHTPRSSALASTTSRAQGNRQNRSGSSMARRRRASCL